MSTSPYASRLFNASCLALIVTAMSFAIRGAPGATVAWGISLYPQLIGAPGIPTAMSCQVSPPSVDRHR